jgi:hypothetical protein
MKSERVERRWLALGEQKLPAKMPEIQAVGPEWMKLPAAHAICGDFGTDAEDMDSRTGRRPACDSTAREDPGQAPRV